MRYNLTTKVFKSGLLFGLASMALSASADVIITQGPISFPGEENLLFNVEGLLDDAPLVQGVLSGSGLLVDIDGAGEDLTTPSGGQARVEGMDGTLTSLRICLDDPLGFFKTLSFNINAVDDGTVTFTVQRLGESDLQATFNIDGGGENFFGFEAINGQSMVCVTLETDVDVADVRQIRLGGAGLVPEPASMGALAVGLAAMLRKRRKA